MIAPSNAETAPSRDPISSAQPGQLWWHAYGGELSDGVWCTTLISRNTSGPDDVDDNGRPMRDPLPPREGGLIDRPLPWLGAWDHEPTDREKNVVLPDAERAPACRICSCTEDDACPGSCWWVPDPEQKGNLCSTCLPGITGRLTNDGEIAHDPHNVSHLEHLADGVDVVPGCPYCPDQDETPR